MGRCGSGQITNYLYLQGPSPEGSRAAQLDGASDTLMSYRAR